MCYQSFRKESTPFTSKIRSSNEYLQYSWQEFFDGDSFVSQSRFDAYATQKSHNSHFKQFSFEKVNATLR